MLFEKPKTDKEIVNRGILKGLARAIVDIPTGIGVGYIVGKAIVTVVPVPAKFGMKLCYMAGYYALLLAAGDAVDASLKPVYDEVFGVTDEEVKKAASRIIHIEVEDVEHPNETVTA